MKRPIKNNKVSKNECPLYINELFHERIPNKYLPAIRSLSERSFVTPIVKTGIQILSSEDKDMRLYFAFVASHLVCDSMEKKARKL